MGFTAIGVNDEVLHRKEPSHISESGSVGFYGDVVQLELDTNSSNGASIQFEITKDGVSQKYECENCLASSPSLALDLVYIDENMNAGVVFNHASCQNSCIFTKPSTLLQAGSDCLRQMHHDPLCV